MATESTFTVLTLNENACVFGVMEELSAHSSVPFLPIKEGNTILVLIPSFTMLATTIATLFPEKLKLTPFFGHLNSHEQLLCLQNGVMPLELDANTKQSADRIFACYAKALMLAANPNPQLLFKMMGIVRSVQVQHPVVDKLRFLKLLTDEEGQPLLHYTQAIHHEQSQQIESFDPEIIFQCLMASFYDSDEIELEELKGYGREKT